MTFSTGSVNFSQLLNKKKRKMLETIAESVHTLNLEGLFRLTVSPVDFLTNYGTHSFLHYKRMKRTCPETRSKHFQSKEWL